MGENAPLDRFYSVIPAGGIGSRLWPLSRADAPKFLHDLTGSGTTLLRATWNRLAGCESGGDWHINTGNGYYGGLQFSLDTWVAMGGRKYASRPDLATPAEQMAIGENLLRASHWSWGAWPVCSRKLHLTEADARATDNRVDGRFVHPPIYTPKHPQKPRDPLGKLVVG